MKATEARELSVSDLEEKLEDARKELFNLRVQQATGQAEQPLRIRTLRREIARIHTIMQEKQAS